MASAIHLSAITSTVPPPFHGKRFIPNPSKCFPSSRTCELKLSPKTNRNNNTSEIIHALHKEGDYLKAFHRQKSDITSQAYYEKLIRRLSSAGKLDDARNVMRLMKKPTKRAYSQIVDGYIKAKKLDQIPLVLQEITAASGLPSTTEWYNITLHALLREYKFTEAESLFSKMRPDTKTFDIMIQAYCKIGRTNTASKLLNEMDANGCPPNVWIFNTLIRGFCEQKDIEGARELMDVMRSYGLNPDIVTYNTLVLGFCNQRTMEEANKLVEEMKSNGIEPNIVTFNTLINGFCEQGRMEEAGKLLEEMCENGLKPNIVTYNILIRRLCEQGRMEVVPQILDIMRTNGIQPDVTIYGSLIQALRKQGRTEEAAILTEKKRIMLELNSNP